MYFCTHSVTISEKQFRNFACEACFTKSHYGGHRPTKKSQNALQLEHDCVLPCHWCKKNGDIPNDPRIDGRCVWSRTECQLPNSPPTEITNYKNFFNTFIGAQTMQFQTAKIRCLDGHLTAAYAVMAISY